MQNMVAATGKKKRLWRGETEETKKIYSERINWNRRKGCLGWEIYN
jgi:hypothetical protein